MLGTLINAAAVIFGSAIGLLFGRFISDPLKKIIMQGIGLCTIAIGISMAIKTASPLIFIVSIVLGGIIGQLLNIERHLERFGNSLKKFSGSGESRFVEGFMSAFLIFCIGGMTIMGTIADGTTGDCTILYTKSMLDASQAMVLSSAMGLGVMFSAIPLLIFQGALTLGAGLLKDILLPAAVTEMSAVGGLLIVGIGLSLLEIKKISLGNLMPAIFVALALSLIFL